MPCTTPPAIWPSTTLGLIMVPQSSPTMYRRIRTWPVTVSTSHVHTWAAFDHVITPPVLNRDVTSRPSGTPSGTSWGDRYATLATSPSVIDLVGVPFTDT